MIVLCRETARNLRRKGIYEVDYVSLGVGMTGLVFEDTPEAREILAGVELDSKFDKIGE